jgi:hypothetical protein
MVVAVVMMPIVAVMAVADVAMMVTRIHRGVVVNRRMMIDRRRDHDPRRANRHDWRADWRSGDNHCRDRQGDANIDAERNAGTCRIGGSGSEGDCDCTE